MKDVSSTSFGFLIAYLLPGFAGLFAISFYAPPVQDLFSQFVEAESNVGRFLLVILCSLVVGLEISVLRWLVFEKILCRKHKRDSSKYEHLADEAKLSAFRAAVDENYRYHQFWGGMAVVTPFIAYGLVSATSGWPTYTLAIALSILEALNIAGGCSAYRNYIDRTNRILAGLAYGERVGTNEGIGCDEARYPKHEAAAASPAATPAPAPAPETAREKIDDGENCEVTGAATPP